MKFNLTRKEVEDIARKESYTVNNVEKVIRLSMILDDLNTLPEFRGNFLLKGGTAINLVAFEKLPRLSVDLGNSSGPSLHFLSTGSHSGIPSFHQ